MKQRAILIMSTMLLVLSSFWPAKAQKRSEVLVVGTIHQMHRDNTNYSYQDLMNILGTFDPDVICVEIPEFYYNLNSAAL